MAITIQTAPPTLSSIHGDLIYTVAEVAKTADPVTYPNYKFVADVYIGATLVARIKKVPDPVTKIGVFNVGQIVRSYMNTTFSPAIALDSQIMTSYEFYLNCTIYFGEEYAYTLYTNLTIDSTRLFFNFYEKRLSNPGALTINGFNSNRTGNLKAFITSKYLFVNYIGDTSSTKSVSINTSDGGSATPSFTDSAYAMRLLNISPYAINLFSPGLINTATTYYTVAVGSKVFRVDLICEGVYDKYTVHFMNQYGGFDTMIFNKVSRKVYDVTKKDFGRLPYTVDSSGVVSYKNSNNVYNETRSVYASQYKEKLTLNSDLLTDAEYSWLADLIFSPMVYIEDNGNLYPCIISQNNYEPKKIVNDDLTNLTISIEFGDQLNAQFR